MIPEPHRSRSMNANSLEDLVNTLQLDLESPCPLRRSMAICELTKLTSQAARILSLATKASALCPASLKRDLAGALLLSQETLIDHSSAPFDLETFE